MKTYMYSSMKFRSRIERIRLQVRSSTEIMGSSFSICHPLQVSQARNSEHERVRRWGGEGARGEGQRRD